MVALVCYKLKHISCKNLEIKSVSKMKIVLSVLAVALIAYVQSNDDNRVPVNISDLNPRDFVTLGSRSYYFSPTDVDAKHALQFCNDVGMTLVSIETKEENDLILGYLKANGLNVWYWTSGMLLLDIYHWTGSGQILTYAPWNTGRPNSTKSSEACIQITPNINYNGWYDWPCIALRRFICEEL